MKLLCAYSDSLLPEEDRPGAHDCVKTNFIEAGYSSGGENVLWYSDGQHPADNPGAGAIQRWLDSPGHYMNAMNDAWKEIGVGYYWCEASDQYHWVTLYKR